MKTIYLVILGLVVFSLVGHGLTFAMSCGHNMSGTEEGQSHTAQCTDSAVKSELIELGNKICPVLEEPIDEATKATYEYEGKIYNFCCAGCIDEFKKDPPKYIEKVNAELEAAKGVVTGELNRRN
jgi:YHS domain-containing protein